MQDEEGEKADVRVQAGFFFFFFSILHILHTLLYPVSLCTSTVRAAQRSHRIFHLT
jgi:hypothetical protein